MGTAEAQTSGCDEALITQLAVETPTQWISHCDVGFDGDGRLVLDRLAWDDEPGLVGEGGRLGAVAQVELGEDALGVCLDGAFADDEGLGDLGVGVSARHEGENLLFARGEGGEPIRTGTGRCHASLIRGGRPASWPTGCWFGELRNCGHCACARAQHQSRPGRVERGEDDEEVD